MIGSIVFAILMTAAFLGLPAVADGAKFIGIGEKSDNFRPLFNQGPCYGVAENLRVCPDDTIFTREDSIATGRDRLELFSVDDRRNAAVKLIYFDLRETLNFDAAKIEALVQQHVFDDAPRGPRILQEVLTPDRQNIYDTLSRRVARVEREELQSILTFTVITLQYGLAFAETTIDLSSSENAHNRLEEAEMFHKEFLEILTTSVNIGPGYR